MIRRILQHGAKKSLGQIKVDQGSATVEMDSVENAGRNHPDHVLAHLSCRESSPCPLPLASHLGRAHGNRNLRAVVCVPLPNGAMLLSCVDAVIVVFLPHVVRWRTWLQTCQKILPIILLAG